MGLGGVTLLESRIRLFPLFWTKDKGVDGEI